MTGLGTYLKEQKPSIVRLGFDSPPNIRFISVDNIAVYVQHQETEYQAQEAMRY